MTTATLLLSRQPLRPNRTTGWVVQVRKAVRYCHSQGYRLLTSHGMQTWEMITAVGAIERVPMRLYTLPDRHTPAERETWLRNQFELESRETEFVHSDEVFGGTEEENLLLARDARIVRDADIVIPISIRRGGAMANLAEAAITAQKEVVAEFLCRYVSRSDSLAYTIDQDTINPELSTLSDRYLFHWTRANNSAWPGERLIDFYSAVLGSESYPRTALDTLSRILRDRMLIASPRHMPGRIPTVSFSGLSPEDTAPLMRWRARYSEMSFEPYAIGLDRSICERAEILPVEYFEKRTSDCDHCDFRWLRQSIGTVTDWRQEKEYRHRGDLSLDGLTADDLIAVTRTPDEAQQIKNRFGVRAVSFCRL